MQVHDLAWSVHGDFLLSASADFTARVLPFQQSHAHLEDHQVSAHRVTASSAQVSVVHFGQHSEKS